MSSKIDNYSDVKQEVPKTRSIVKDIKSVGIQTDRQDTEKVIKDMKERRQMKITNTLTKIIDDDWKPDNYKITKVELQNMLNADTGEGTVFFINAKAQHGDKEVELLKMRYPTALSLLQEGLIKGKLEFMSTQTKIKMSTGTHYFYCLYNWTVPV